MKDKQIRYFDFGPFRVDAAERMLMRGPETVPVTPKAFELLLALVVNSGRVVLKEDLMKTLWPDTFVEESNLSQHILQLRKVLGSNGRDSQYIVTVPGRGYRFAEKVEEVPAEDGVRTAAGDGPSQPVAVQPARIMIPWHWVATGALAVVAAVALGSWWRATRPVIRPLLKLSVELPDFAVPDQLHGSSLAISPDGMRIVYTGRGPDGKFRLYSRLLDLDRATPMAGTEGGREPFFSPDGKMVGFFSERALKKIPVEGGEAVYLCEARGDVGASWGEDGTIVAAFGPNGGISKVSTRDGQVRQITELKPEKSDFAHLWPQVIPGTDSVLFTEIPRSVEMGDATIEVQSMKTGERKTLVHGALYGRYAVGGYLVYLQGETLYAAPMDRRRLVLTGPPVAMIEGVARTAAGSVQLDLSQNGTLVYERRISDNKTLMWLDSRGRTQPLRAASENFAAGIRFSPDGKRLALAKNEGDNVDIWVYDLEKDQMTRLTFGATAWFPMWSPDGAHIAFMSAMDGGASNIYSTRADGAGNPVRLTRSEKRQIPYSFSPDGKQLAFFEFDPKTQADIWTLPLEDGNSDHPKAGKPEPFLVTPSDERLPVISPDGRWLAYQSDESGREEVYVKSFPGPGGRWQVSAAGGNRPVWSKTTPELFFRSSEGVMVATYTERGEAFVAASPRLWAAKRELGPYFDVAPDGKRLVIFEPEESGKPDAERVMLLQGFMDEGRRRTTK